MTVLGTLLGISINLLLFVFVIVCLLMSMIILMQRPKNEGLGAAFGSNTTDQLFGARTTNVLQKATVYLSTLFFVITLALAVLIGKRNASQLSLQAAVPTPPAKVEEKPASIAEEAAKEEKPITPEAVTPPVQVPTETPTPAPVPTPAEETKPEAESKPESTPAEETKPEETKPAEEKPPGQ
ncbi:preprotein translocase subunit SecG [Luteolibacter soli]|uniref:Protein-export membrane protein SecG n=1 Tax=Luteolibacter soli TaxID=3135280 RepID=A0ABU9B394_9BACT